MQSSPVPRTWLWLRGLTRSAQHWGAFKEKFAGRFQSDPIICLDLPGAGSKRAEESPTTIGRYTDCLRAEWHRLQPNGKITGLGLSMGGMILLDWCQRYPQDFSGLVLINTSAANLGWPWERLNYRALAIAVRLICTPGRAGIEKEILGLVANSIPNREVALELWQAISLKEPPHTANMLRQMLAAAKFRANFSLAFPPTLILGSAGDRLVQPRLSAALSNKVSGSILRMHPTAGHDLPIDDGDWLIQQVVDWLGGGSPQQ